MIIKFLLFFTMFFFLPILLLFCCFRFITNHFYDENKEQITNIQLQNVQDAKNMMDEYMQRAKIASRTLLHNENVHYILSTDLGLHDIDDRYIDSIMKQLRNTWLENNFIHDIVVCFQDKDINIMHTGVKTNLEIYDKYIRKESNELTYQDWRQQLGWFTRGRLLSFDDGSLYFIRSYPSTPIGVHSGSNVFIKMDNSVLTSLLRNTDTSLGEFIAIIDGKTGANVFGNYQNKIPMISTENFIDFFGCFEEKGYLYSYAKSSQIDAVYVSGINLSVINEQRDKTIKLGAIAFAVVSIIGILVSYQFIKRTYDPINQLFALAKGKELAKSNPLDPYYEIKSMLLEAAEKELTYNNMNKQQSIYAMKEILISTLYNEKCTEEQIAICAKRIQLEVENKVTCFIKIKCTDISSYFEIYNQYENENAPIHFCENIILKLLTHSFHSISFRDGRELLFLVVLEDKKVDVFNTCIKENLEQAQRFLRESYGMETMITLSDFHSGYIGIKNSFQEVNKAMEYIEMVGNKSFARYNMIPTFEYSNEYSFSMIEEENYLLNYIKAGEFNKAKKHFNKIINYYFTDTPHAPQIWKFRLYGLINNILRTLNYVNVPDMKKLIDTVNKSSSLLICNNAVEFQNQINLLFDKLEEFCIKSTIDSEEQFKNKIIDIVTRNYMNPDLSVSLIADMLNKNLDYLSRTFKKLTNVGLLDYIHEYRINKAKTYFKEDDTLSVQQVASMVGYVSCESFIRAFKRKEGVTPGRYKVMLENQSEFE